MRKTKNKQLDKWTTIVGLCVPLVTLPQLYTVLTAQNLDGVSLITWGFYTIQAGIFAIFGIKHRERPLIYTYIPLFAVQLSIVIAIVVRKI